MDLGGEILIGTTGEDFGPAGPDPGSGWRFCDLDLLPDSGPGLEEELLIIRLWVCFWMERF